MYVFTEGNLITLQTYLLRASLGVVVYVGNVNKVKKTFHIAKHQ